MVRLKGHIFFKSLMLVAIFLGASAFKTGKDVSFYDSNKGKFVSFRDVSDNVKRLYEKDATRLALRHISKNGAYASLSPKIPAEVKDELFGSLLAVHTSGSLEATEVTQGHKLHTFPNPPVDKLQVVYSVSASWAKPLRLKDTTTDSDIINSLCQEYGLEIQDPNTWDDDSGMFVLKSGKALNMSSIMKELERVPGIERVDPLIPNMDGNDIEATKTGNGWRLDYIVKFGNCLKGECAKKHVWSFEISNISSLGANVRFLEESGDELPGWMQWKPKTKKD